MSPTMRRPKQAPCFPFLFSLFLCFVNNKLSSSYAHVFNEDHPDRMKSLPGYPYDLPTAWYSGYVTYKLEDVQVHTHYMLIQAAEASSSSEKETPLIYWTNGGPGATSMFGLFTELGPLLLSDLSLQTKEYKQTGIPTPLYNPTSWNQLGHVLIFDAPAPVGFSYCTNLTNVGGNGTEGCPSWTDELASLNTYLALQTFYTSKFPELRSIPLFLTGESYAGIYVPTLARRILQGQSDFEMNLQGFAVGDGCLGTQTEVCGGLGGGGWKSYYFHVLFLAGHGQIPYAEFQQVLKVCDTNATHEKVHGKNMMHSSRVADFRNITQECQDILSKLQKDVGGYYSYSLYDDCTYRNSFLLRQNLHRFQFQFHDESTLNQDKGVYQTPGQHGAIGGGLNDYPCGQGPVMDHYLTLSAVRSALNIPSNVSYLDVDNANGFDYTPTEPDLTPFYHDVATGKYGSPPIKVLVYNGDTDPSITSFAAQDWTSRNLNLTLQEDWRPWTLDGCKRMGGYVTRYEGGFDFLTVRGAGHMVPTYKPEATLVFLKGWLEGGGYPDFDEDCKSPEDLRGKVVPRGGEEMLVI